ncbi:AAA family ATPase [Leptolinea tardivitalis]|uniref:ATPase AAA-type core domain-containing protein n=1 Tax=Leptolinea tardivitalis TaxID=229920 RepID=A0A0P6X5Y3_9CHLR|nr:ATP-binding protein [Leptolinea tardivitalis]KPL70333.1 hypothetical protein ADM99_14335 [Leptolinea tardivitalis]GAP21896.1 predicted ATPase [Leptolinea tardivitalis]
MLVEFRLKNYRCFKDEQVLNLTAGSDLSLSDNVIKPPDTSKFKILRSVVIYGPNASGKTKVLEALKFIRDFVRESANRKPDETIDTQPFLLDPVTSDAPSTFEITFIQDRVRYQYGISVDHTHVWNEYLYAAPKGRTVPYFQRAWNKNTKKEEYYFGPSLKGQNEKISLLTRDNALFLSVAATFKHPMLSAVYQWFSGIILELNPLQETSLDLVNLNGDYHQGIRDLLRYADLGIWDYKVKEPSIPENKFQWIGERIEMLHQTHDNKVVAFPLSSESNGTKHILFLSQLVLRALETGNVLVVDEMDASMHPLLVRAIVEMFHNPAINQHNAQLIFNTHDTTLLDNTLFRRDQIWFTEKDQEGASHLYSLLEYSPRKGESLAKGYLQGRYGAIPFLGDVYTLLEKDGVQ